MPVDDPGRPNVPGRLDAESIRWEKAVPPEWWRNSHRAAPPLAFSKALGRFSGPDLPYPVLYLGANPTACFWESGLGRDLNARMPGDRAIGESALKDRWEYRVRVRVKGLHLFNASDPAARRSVGARTAACFLAEHAVARVWANALMAAGADGILYESARQSPGQCLALFETKPAIASLSAPRKVGSSYDNASLLAELFVEGVSIIGV
jgi:hypothetical protein